MSDLSVELELVCRSLLDLLRIPSPTGLADAAVDYMEKAFQGLGLETRRTRKGALLAVIPGQRADGARTLAAHVDTLGAMVKEIKPNGRLKLSRIGGYQWHTVQGEYCTIHTMDGQTYSGTVLATRASTHVHGGELREIKWEDQDMEVRLDVPVTHREAVLALGIQVGDYISWDPRATLTPSGYIKSRHLDNKAAAAILIGLAAALKSAPPLPRTAYLFISNYEEVGHGAAAGIPADTAEMIAVDMAAVGEGQTSNEHSVTICVKDSSGPYDHALSRRLVELAHRHEIRHQVDIYPFYASDASAALRAGLEARAALVGPGVDASHAYERTHRDALEATARLLLAYLQSS